MLNKKRAKLLVAILGLLAFSISCGLDERVLKPSATLSPVTNTPLPSPESTPTLIPQLQTPDGLAVPQANTASEVGTTPAEDDANEAWQSLRPGLERRRASLMTDDGSVRERLYMLRIDPELYRFDVGYRPGAPQRLMDWQEETGALIVVNGGFFTAENEATGLVVVNGQASGTSYVGFGGMFAITDSGPVIRSLIQQPYSPDELLYAGLQSFPILVAPDGQIGFPQEDGLADRRTVIAQDRQGNVLLILATTGSLTLHQMSRYLAESDLDVNIALNLDGGASTGLQLAEPSEGVAPFSDLPIVITVSPKT